MDVKPTVVFWHRRDLRIEDNAGLYHALVSATEIGAEVRPVFIFDRQILDALTNQSDARVSFIYQAIGQLKEAYRAVGSDLAVYYGLPEEIWSQIIHQFSPVAVHTNRDYEPYAVDRDTAIAQMLRQRGIDWSDHKDHVILEKSEVLSGSGKPYTVFTPYSKNWLKTVNEQDFQAYPVHQYQQGLAKGRVTDTPSLEQMGFVACDLAFPDKVVTDSLLQEYAAKRNFPALPATSRLGVHLRFGTISIRALARQARQQSETFVNELIWRDFYQMLLHHFPHTHQQAFKPDYDRIEWRQSLEDFERWKAGKTGYPIVDAGMRELAATGFMHNRVRMITASFLCKSLLLDWRWGEAWFAEKLLDYEMASNVGGWQWAASSGADAAPYFRIFNPALQQEKFDPHGRYIKQWLPEWGTAQYPKPMVDHAFARQRALAAYESAVKAKTTSSEHPTLFDN